MNTQLLPLDQNHMMNMDYMFDMQICMLLRYKLDKSHKNFQINNVNYRTMNNQRIQKILSFQYHRNKNTGMFLLDKQYLMSMNTQF